MSDERVKPALTAEEWREGYDSEDLTVRLRNSMATEGMRVFVTVRGHPLGGALGDPRDIHALAALCLHGQPFGFTREDVKLVRDCIGAEWDRIDSRAEERDLRARLESLADRLEALLPPEHTP